MRAIVGRINLIKRLDPKFYAEFFKVQKEQNIEPVKMCLTVKLFYQFKADAELLSGIVLSMRMCQSYR